MSKEIMLQADTLVVTDNNSLIQASTILGKLKTLLKTVKGEEDSLTANHLAEITKIRAVYKPKRDKINAVITSISNKVNTYQTEEAIKLAEIEAKLAKRVEKGTLKMETAVRKMEEVVKPVEEFKTTEGSVKFRTVDKLDITDSLAIPREYLTIDEAKVFADLKAGKTIAGARIIQVKSISNYGK